MKKWLWLICVGWILASPVLASAFPIDPQTRKENRRMAREQRKALRYENRKSYDNKRQYKENYKQRKKMIRESRRSNRNGFDANQLGNYFGL